MSLTSVHRIVKRDLSLKCVKRTLGQELTAANKAARLARCRKLFTSLSARDGPDDVVYRRETVLRRCAVEQAERTLLCGVVQEEDIS